MYIIKEFSTSQEAFLAKVVLVSSKIPILRVVAVAGPSDTFLIVSGQVIVVYSRATSGGT